MGPWPDAREVVRRRFVRLRVLGEHQRAAGVGEHPIDLPERVVPGRALGRPPARQLLAGLEDLLDVDGEGVGQG
ncbi:hypothetical protein [Microbacterium aurum]